MCFCCLSSSVETHLSSFTVQVVQGGFYHFPGAGLWSSSSWTINSIPCPEWLVQCVHATQAQPVSHTRFFLEQSGKETFSQGLLAVTKMYPVAIFAITWETCYGRKQTESKTEWGTRTNNHSEISSDLGSRYFWKINSWLPNYKYQ